MRDLLVLMLIVASKHLLLSCLFLVSDTYFDSNRKQMIPPNLIPFHSPDSRKY